MPFSPLGGKWEVAVDFFFDLDKIYNFDVVKH